MIIKIIDITTIAKSILVCILVRAQILKWNKAGSVKATGMQAKEPKIDKKRSTFYPRSTAEITAIPLARVLLIR